MSLIVDILLNPLVKETFFEERYQGYLINLLYLLFVISIVYIMFFIIFYIDSYDCWLQAPPLFHTDHEIIKILSTTTIATTVTTTTTTMSKQSQKIEIVKDNNSII